jgi:hypothetical protein
MNQQNQWYVTIEGNAVGPVSTDLVVRGIKHKKIATTAFVCIVGASEWQSLTDIAEFHDALSDGDPSKIAPPRNGHQQPLNGVALPSVSTPEDRIVAGRLPLKDADDDDESETTASFSSRRPHQMIAQADEGTSTPVDAPLDNHKHEAEPRNGNHAELKLEGRPPFPSIDLDIDVTVDDTHEADIDWGHGFAAYFLVDSDVTLPDEHRLLRSLSSVSRDKLLHDEAMWNLALCLAYGSDAVANAAAEAFFEVVTAHELIDRIEWMSRTLLSRGFMPSGIPHAAGYRGLSHLQTLCPPELQPQLEREILS